MKKKTPRFFQRNRFTPLSGAAAFPRKKGAGFIVFEGIDGSGKATQLKLLSNALRKEGYQIELLDFPQYGKKSAGLVEEYLTGKYGSSDKVGPYPASFFYAADRYDASFQIRKWLGEGKIVLSDRYVGSNIGHQGGKIKNKKERKKYFQWLYNLEYNIFKIPKPDVNFILRVPPETAQLLSRKITDKEKKAKKKAYLGRKRRDIHEKDLLHLINAEKAYLQAAREFPRDFKIINCFQNKKLLSPEIVHQRILKKVKKLIH